MSQKNYLYILKAGVIISLVTVFLVFKNLLFPYITSKQIPFNILVEILAIFWFTFIIKYPLFNPFKYKKNLITIGLAAYFLVIFITCFTGVDFNLSFWGDIERMLGFFSIVHFLFLYFIIITVFRSWRDWYALFLASIIVSSIVAIYGFVIGKPFSTIGNTAYVAGYMIFNIYFCLLLFFKTKNKWRWLYLLPFIVVSLGFKRADISGAVVGFSSSMVLLFLLLAFLSKRKTIKIVSLSVFILLLISFGAIYFNKDAEFVKTNSWFKQITDVSLGANTFQTRLISWRAAFYDFKNHPVLGIGYGNYAIIFDKYFDPQFYIFSRAETYFDRAHNNIVDITSTTGALGLATYLLFFVAAVVYLFKLYFKGKIPVIEFVLLVSLLAAYFVQNLAVFDSLVTYLCLMLTLGYIFWLNEREEEVILPESNPVNNKEIACWVGFGIIFLFIIYRYNISALKMLTNTIDSQVYLYQGEIEKSYEAEKQALSYNSGLERDSRSTFVRSFSGSMGPALLKKISTSKAEEILDYCIGLTEQNLDYDKADSMALLTQAEIYNTAAIYHYADSKKFYYYSNKAVEAMDKSIAASPRRTTLFFSKAQILFVRGDVDKAIETLNYAVNLDKDFSDGYCNLAQVYFSTNKKDEGWKQMNICVDRGGAAYFTSENFL
jgi:O-antigen ligase